MARTGRCLCGAVAFEIDTDLTETGACHCGMCRKASGGVFLGVRVPADKMHFTAEEGHKVYTSSPWAERGFCSTCGSTLYYRVTAPGEHQGVWHVGLGALDDPEGIVMTEEIFIDKKPGGYGFAGDTKKMTEADIMKMFAAG